MARTPRNKLTLSTLPNGSFRLFGYVDGTKIRKQSSDGGKLQLLKEKLEGSLAQVRSGTVLRGTWLSEEQLREAEAATLAAQGRKLTVCVEIARREEGNTAQEPVAWEAAIADYCAHLEKRLRRFPRTVDKNRVRLADFAKRVAGDKVHEATAAEVERWIFRGELAASTQLTDASVLRAFFRYAVKRRWCAKSPVQIEPSELTHRAGSAQRPRILTPDQCGALAKAARELFAGELLPFVILSTWCFMRRAEVCRTTRADIDLKNGRVSINPRKQGTPSYRTVDIPANALRALKRCVRDGLIKKEGGIAFNRSRFDAVRAAAGMMTLGERKVAHGRREVLASEWQDNILRHSGISYLYQKTGDMKEVCRQAGNSDDTAFKHYLSLPVARACEKFYGLKL